MPPDVSCHLTTGSTNAGALGLKARVFPPPGDATPIKLNLTWLRCHFQRRFNPLLKLELALEPRNLGHLLASMVEHERRDCRNSVRTGEVEILFGVDLDHLERGPLLGT